MLRTLQRQVLLDAQDASRPASLRAKAREAYCAIQANAPVWVLFHSCLAQLRVNTASEQFAGNVCRWVRYAMSCLVFVAAWASERTQYVSADTRSFVSQTDSVAQRSAECEHDYGSSRRHREMQP